MAYYYPAKPPATTPAAPASTPANYDVKKVIDNVKNTIQAPLSGFWQGFSGRNMTYEQWLAYKKRSKKVPPRRNWLQRAIGI